MKKSNRGGARAGSGRKKTKNVSLCVRMPRDTVEYIRRKSTEEKVPIGSWIAKRIETEVRNDTQNGEHEK